MNASDTKLLMIVATAFALSSSGCTNTSSCSRGTDATTVDFNPSTLVGNIYVSSPDGGPYTFYPGGRTVTFKLDHHLGEAPYDVQFLLAFSSDGTLAPSSGNMTELVPEPADAGPDAGISPALNSEGIRVYNDTCSDFYLQVRAVAPLCDGAICDLQDSEASAAGAAGASP